MPNETETVEVAGRVVDRKEENCDRLGLWRPHAQNFTWPESLHSRSLQHSMNATNATPCFPQQLTDVRISRVWEEPGHMYRHRVRSGELP